eukprot:2500435-Alexandrium_andersonii.AAC.1
MDRGVAVFDLVAAGDQLLEPERSAGMGDAGIEDLTDSRPVDEPPASAASGCSGDRRAGSGGQPYRDDVTGAVLDSELVAAARTEEIRFAESWHVWDVRPISERVARAGKRPIGGRRAGHNKGDSTAPNVR